MSDHRAETLTKALLPLVDEAQLELVEATWTGTTCRTHVHVFVHGDNGVTAKQLARLHRAVEATIEERGLLTAGSYHLEVSTPGVKRPLKTARDFERNLGRKVRVFLDEPLDGKVELEGKISGVNGSSIEIDDGGPIKVPLASLRQGKLVIDMHFDKPARRPKRKKKRKQKSGSSGRKAQVKG